MFFSVKHDRLQISYQATKCSRYLPLLHVVMLQLHPLIIDYLFRFQMECLAPTIWKCRAVILSTFFVFGLWNGFCILCPQNMCPCASTSGYLIGLLWCTNDQ